MASKPFGSSRKKHLQFASAFFNEINPFRICEMCFAREIFASQMLKVYFISQKAIAFYFTISARNYFTSNAVRYFTKSTCIQPIRLFQKNTPVMVCFFAIFCKKIIYHLHLSIIDKPLYL